MSSPIDKAREVFQRHGGALRTREALAAGLHPRTLYALRDAGELEQLSRGVYRLAGLPPMSEPDLATVAKRIPGGVLRARSGEVSAMESVRPPRDAGRSAD